MSISTPTKITVPFANSAGTYKNTIPVPSQISITPGAASFTDGFPPLTMTPKASGGLPPFGQDMNGVLFNVTQAIQYSQAGGLFPYDSVFSTAVGGYPNGAVVQASDRSCLWLNSVANNTTAPESFGAGWSPLCAYGETLISLSSSNVTLTALQSAKNIIILSGAISTNLNIILPTYLKQWTIVNNCTGAYSVTAKTASGSGVIIANGNAIEVYGDGTNINQSINFAQKSITQISSDSSTNIATTAFVNNSCIGLGQTWTDVTASRALATTYYNTSGKPIFIYLNSSQVSNTTGAFTLNINSISFVLCQQSSTSWPQLAGGVLIPTGASYSVTSVGYTLLKWVELR